MCAVKRAVEIHSENGPPIGFRNILERTADLAHHSTCIVYEDVDAAGRLEHFSDCSLYLRAVAHIQRANFKRRRLFFCQTRGFSKFSFKDVASDNACAKRSEIQRNAAAEAVRGASHNRGSMIKADLHGIYECFEHLLFGSGTSNSAANGPRASNQNSVAAHGQGPSSASRVSSTPTRHICVIWSSGFWYTPP